MQFVRWDWLCLLILLVVLAGFIYRITYRWSSFILPGYSFCWIICWEGAAEKRRIPETPEPSLINPHLPGGICDRVNYMAGGDKLRWSRESVIMDLTEALQNNQRS